jgi:hypothetical protein
MSDIIGTIFGLLVVAALAALAINGCVEIHNDMRLEGRCIERCLPAKVEQREEFVCVCRGASEVIRLKETR